LLGTIPTVLLGFTTGEQNAHHQRWHQLMESRRPFLKQINPHEHFAHILGDVHVLMKAGQKYTTNFIGVDIFGSPLIYKSHLNPRFHIFNSDFDSKIHDVYVEGSRVLIRTSHPDHMLNLKIRKGHIFSTAVDWTQSDDEIHEGSLDLLINEDPIRIGPNVLMLENVKRMEFDDLWNLADIHMDVQNYQYTAPNGTVGYRVAPMTYTIFDIQEETSEDQWESGNELDPRLWGFIKKMASPIVNVVRKVVTTVVNTVVNVVKTVVAVVTGGEQLNSFNFSFNYDSRTGKASREIPLYSFSRSATATSGSNQPAKPPAGQKPKPAGVSASVSASISLDVICTNCYGLATFRTETRLKVSLTSKPSFEYKISGDFTLKSEIALIIIGKVTATVDVPIGPSFTATDPKATSVSGKAARYDIKAGLYASGALSVELTGKLIFEFDLVISGYISAGVRGITPFFESDFAVKKSSFGMRTETQIVVKWELFFGPKLTGSIYNVGIAAAAGVAFENELEITPECQRWVRGEVSQLVLRATVDIDLPSIFNNIGIKDISKKWIFFKYVVRPLLGCFLDSDPNGPPPKDAKALPPATAVQTSGGQVFNFGDVVLPTGQYYSVVSGPHRYDFNIGTPAYGTPCGGINVGICQTHVTEGRSLVLGQFNRDIVSQDDGSFLMHYRNGNSQGCPSSNPRQGKIIMECDRSAASPRVDRAVEVSSCSYEIYMKTKDACLEPCAGFVGTRRWDFTPLKEAGPFYYAVNGTTYSVALCGESVPNCNNAGACAAAPIGALSIVN